MTKQTKATNHFFTNRCDAPDEPKEETKPCTPRIYSLFLCCFYALPNPS